MNDYHLFFPSFSRYLSLFLITVSFISKGDTYSPEYINRVTDYYLGSYGGLTLPQAAKEEDKEELTAMEKFASYFKHKEIPPFTRILTESEKRSLLLTQFPLSSYNSPAIVNTQLLYDERVLNGGKKPHENLASRLFSTHLKTLAGERYMIEVISQPLSDIKKLTARQAVVKELTFNDTLLENLTTTLKIIGDNELAFLNIYIDKGETEKQAINQLLFGSWFDTLNKNSAILEIKRRLVQTAQCMGMTFPFLLSAYISYQYERNLKKNSIIESLANATVASTFPITFLYPFKSHFIAKTNLIKNRFEAISHELMQGNRENAFNLTKNLTPAELSTIGFRNVQELNHSLTNFSPETLTRVGLALFPRSIGDMRGAIQLLADENQTDALEINTFFNGLLGLTTATAYGATATVMWNSYRNATFENNITMVLQQHLIQLSRYVRGCQKLYLIIKDNPVLSHNLSLIGKLESLINHSNAHTLEFNQLITLLNSATFSENATFFSLAGKVLAAEKMMESIRGEFNGMVEALGEIDMAVALAQLYKSYARTNTPFCFPVYETSDTPHIAVTDFWNPFLNPTHAVTNSVEFGKTAPRTMVLTGPNTGGKSTCIEGILLTAFLAQTITIAPARSLSFTPFEKITLYARIIDDIGAGDSRFQAEVKASKQQLEAASNLKPRSFSLNARDEGIVGTDREVGENAEKFFTEKLGETPNSINLLSTHYKKLIDLEEDAPGLFKNYHMRLERTESGKLIRHFTLAPGATTLNVAMDILQEHGIF